MKTIKRIVFGIICLFSITACSQNIDEGGKISRQKAELFIDNNLKNETENNKYIIFSVSDKIYLVIIEKNDIYEEYFIDTESNNSKREKKIYKKENEILKKMFQISNYKQDYITFDSDFFKPEYEIASGSITYFVLVDENKKRYGEARLSIFISPNPIPTDIYLHLVNQAIFYTKNKE